MIKRSNSNTSGFPLGMRASRGASGTASCARSNSHHAAHAPKPMVQVEIAPEPSQPANDENIWTVEAERELKKIPFFVRGKARRNTEAFALDHGRAQIDLETLYDAKAHYAR